MGQIPLLSHNHPTIIRERIVDKISDTVTRSIVGCEEIAHQIALLFDGTVEEITSANPTNIPVDIWVMLRYDVIVK